MSFDPDPRNRSVGSLLRAVALSMFSQLAFRPLLQLWDFLLRLSVSDVATILLAILAVISLCNDFSNAPAYFAARLK